MTISKEILTELIAEARIERVNAVGDVERHEAELARLRERVAILAQEEEALSSVLNRRFPGDDHDLHVEEGAPGIIAVYDESLNAAPRTTAVQTAIKMLNASRPAVSPGDIEDFLRKAGRSDTRDEIGGAVAHLNRTRKIHSLGRGRWVYGPGLQKTSEDAVGAAPSEDSVTTTRPGGDGHAEGPDVAPDHDPTPGGRNDRDQHRETADVVAVDS